MEFSLLGPVTATDDEHGELPLGPPKRRSVLAMLLLQPNTTVSVEQLTASVWEEEPPAHARTVIQGHVSKLRATLAEAGAAAHGVELTTRGSAYRLRLPATLVDAHRFSELAASARPEEDPGRAVGLLQEALSLWRGPALTGTVTSPPLAAAAHALEERRLAAVETLAAAYGTLGDHDRAAAVLSAEAVTHPLREGLVAALMLALYRAGRQSDALDRYHHTRRLLADELGVDPGERLRAAYQSILAGDSPPADRQPPRRGTVPPPGRPGGAPPAPRHRPPSPTRGRPPPRRSPAPRPPDRRCPGPVTRPVAVPPPRGPAPRRRPVARPAPGRSPAYPARPGTPLRRPPRRAYPPDRPAASRRPRPHPRRTPGPRRRSRCRPLPVATRRPAWRPAPRRAPACRWARASIPRPGRPGRPGACTAGPGRPRRPRSPGHPAAAPSRRPPERGRAGAPRPPRNCSPGRRPASWAARRSWTS
ncbi:AfsR/SARP family transcriptional regulator [Streptomyces pactum]|uniref:AfsR/SARP family transcriptional regulator n=1 Tax=Streptomyces pactum TaxID=68249 RepID=UPI0027DE56F7|nr:AfsR/SARP family transcriptional regulator [Streptomyces pactum]